MYLYENYLINKREFECRYKIFNSQTYIKGILKLVLTYIFSTCDEGCFFK